MVDQTLIRVTQKLKSLVRLEQEKAIIADAIETLQNYANDTSKKPYVIFVDEDSVTISYDNGTVTNGADDVKITVPHNYTLANGYTYENNRILKPDGTELFVD